MGARLPDDLGASRWSMVSAPKEVAAQRLRWKEERGNFTKCLISDSFEAWNKKRERERELQIKHQDARREVRLSFSGQGKATLRWRLLVPWTPEKLFTWFAGLRK